MKAVVAATNLWKFARELCIFSEMATATVTTEGDVQTVRLPRGYHLPTPTVQIRHEGDAIVLEPLKPRAWPPGFFQEIHITDPSFTRPEQGILPSIKTL